MRQYIFMDRRIFPLLVLSLVGIVLISGCTSETTESPSDTTPPTQPSTPSEPSTPPVTTTTLKDCLSTIDENTFPSSMGGYSGTPVKLTAPFKWTGADGVETSMTLSNGYTNTYTSGSKMIMSQIVKLQSSSDYNKISTDLDYVKENALAGTITEETVKGVTAHVWDLPDNNMVTYSILVGDNVFVYLMFTETTLNEASSWVDTWVNHVC